ncbi:hypothetical protein GCM10010965_30100 [Caldalkalibacillus thermarum]|uniref:M20/M25/M40 family metallo-hydrolase n=1 Tax=Caldalkalibacillus thermarum TaxID=296745 RepID=UPI0016688DF3|nr:M20/M25/M40 family metallo-hydrolase [Caldalkalibacillus thermarum]GGK35102.1 hypothetical protein GCM10010965_30100 [Caldalkalibacillus thermarum]
MNRFHWNTPEKIRELILELVGVPSVSGTAGEARMADYLIGILKRMPYFQAHPEYVQKHPLPHDPLSRSFVTALVKGRKPSPKTAILLSHFDVVGVSDFGPYAPFAFQPEIYTEKIKAIMDTLEDEVREDLRTGDWLFGRGVMDMKAGLAIQLAVLSQFASDEAFCGNLLLVATPDEERNSEGMLAAVPVLNRIKEEHGLEYQVCICSEPSFSGYPGDKSKYVYTGSMGKLLPLVYAVGKETHAGEPLEGLNAAWMVAEAVVRMELSGRFAEQWEGEQTPLPTCLKLSDLKEEYNVQTPNAAYALFNVLTMRQTPGEVLAKVKEAVEAAARSIAERQKRFRPKVFFFHELVERGRNRFGSSFEEALQRVIDQGRVANADLRDVSVQLADEASKFFLADVPFYLIMLAPPYYPHVYLNDTHPKERRLASAMEKVVEEARRHGETVKIVRYFPGLSDICYCRVVDADQVLEPLRQNMPLYGNLYKLPFQDMVDLNLPAVNIGPYGKDAHKRTERLELHYSTTVVPAMLVKAIRYLLYEDERS